MSTVTQALYITVLGMGLVFLTLGILLVLMTVLHRSFPERETPAQGRRKRQATDAPGDEIGPEVVAAVSVALACALEDQQRSLESQSRPPSVSTDVGLSGWVTAGRTRQLNRSRARGIDR